MRFKRSAFFMVGFCGVPNSAPKRNPTHKKGETPADAALPVRLTQPLFNEVGAAGATFAFRSGRLDSHRARHAPRIDVIKDGNRVGSIEQRRGFLLFLSQNGVWFSSSFFLYFSQKNVWHSPPRIILRCFPCPHSAGNFAEQSRAFQQDKTRRRPAPFWRNCLTVLPILSGYSD